MRFTELTHHAEPLFSLQSNNGTLILTGFLAFVFAISVVTLGMIVTRVEAIFIKVGLVIFGGMFLTGLAIGWVNVATESNRELIQANDVVKERIMEKYGLTMPQQVMQPRELSTDVMKISNEKFIATNRANKDVVVSIKLSKTGIDVIATSEGQELPIMSSYEGVYDLTGK